MTDTNIDGLPLGMFVTSGESEQIITKGLLLLKYILPENKFGGKAGPEIFMSDDCEAQQNNLHQVYLNSKIWLCSFHVLQSVWRWLLDSNHGVHSDDRQHLYGKFKVILTSKTEDDYKVYVREFQDSPLTKKYPKFEKYVASLLKCSDKWIHHFRMSNRNNNTNNVVEAAMGVLKKRYSAALELTI